MERSDDSLTKCKFFVKKSETNRRQIRNIRQESSSSDDEEHESAIVMNTNRKRNRNPMIQSTHSFNQLKKKKPNINENQSNDSNNDSNELRTDDNSFSVSYRSNRSGLREGPEDMGATSIVETETEKSKDAQSIYERALEVNKELKGKEEDHIYRGLHNYTHYISKKDTPQGNASSGFVRKGPVRAPDNIRSTVRWDYQPDLCKDYKETGFCGFGDSCKFLHDRTDYKSGWQLELDSNKDNDYNQQDLNQYKIEDDEELPFKCFICRESFRSPVVTKCKHYFCEKCALDHFKKSSRCYVCGNQTMGVFNTAKEIIKRLNPENSSSGSKQEIIETNVNEDQFENSDSD